MWSPQILRSVDTWLVDCARSSSVSVSKELFIGSQHTPNGSLELLNCPAQGEKTRSCGIHEDFVALIGGANH